MQSTDSKDYNKEEPLPKNTIDIKVWDLVLKDMSERDEHGILTYGISLSPFNGRDPMLDLYQELLDSVVYIRQVLYERYKQWRE